MHTHSECSESLETKRYRLPKLVWLGFPVIWKKKTESGAKELRGRVCIISSRGMSRNAKPIVPSDGKAIGLLCAIADL